MEYERNIRTNIFAADNMTWGQYAKEMTVNLVVIGIAYWKLCFQALNGLSGIASKVLFFLLMIFIVGVEASLVDKKGKNTMNACMVAILVFGLYNMAAYFKVFKKLYICMLVLSLVLSILYLCALFAERRKKRSRRTKKECLWQGFIAVRTIFAIGLIIPVIQLCVSAFLGHQLYIADRNITILQEGEKDVPTAWIQLFDEVDVMWKAEWQQVPTQKKLDKLQTVADFERVRIGIPFEIKIGTKALEENVLAAYNPKDRSISIGLDTLENYSGPEVLHSLMHEMEHATQAAQVELYYDTEEKYRRLNIFYKTRKYANELVNYEGGGGEAYENQQVEQDAERSAEAAMSFYVSMHNAYKSGQLSKLAEEWEELEK